MPKSMLHTTITQELLEEIEEFADETLLPKSILIEQFIKLGLHIAKTEGFIFVSNEKAEKYFHKKPKAAEEHLKIDRDKEWVAIEAGDRQRQTKKWRKQNASRSEGEEALQQLFGNSTT